MLTRFCLGKQFLPKLNAYNIGNKLHVLNKRPISTGIVNKMLSSSKNSNFLTFFRFKSAATESSTIITQPPSVGVWLATCSFMVAGAIIIGGYTRLKNAGLSMVRWELVDDMFLPNTEDKWLTLYEEYKQFPEYKFSEEEITLNKFKKIYFLEYFHRIWGRLTGFVFFIPTVLFLITGKLKGLEKRAVIYNLLVLAQGVMGWIMVKSGLKEETMSSHGDPGVSQYRLASHLGLALILYSLTTWQALKILLPLAKVPPGFTPNITKSMLMSGHIALLMMFITSLYGGIVAGMDAGKVCDTYPKMNGKWIPDGLGGVVPAWRNLFENPLTAQFIHRILAHITAGTCIYAVCKALKMNPMPTRIIFACSAVLSVTIAQMYFGVKTVLSGVDIELALNHQLGAVIMLTSLLLLSLEISQIKKGNFKKSAIKNII